MLLKSPVFPYKQTSKLKKLKALGQSNCLKSKIWISSTPIVDTYKRYTSFFFLSFRRKQLIFQKFNKIRKRFTFFNFNIVPFD